MTKEQLLELSNLDADLRSAIDYGNDPRSELYLRYRSTDPETEYSEFGKIASEMVQIYRWHVEGLTANRVREEYRKSITSTRLASALAHATSLTKRDAAKKGRYKNSLYSLRACDITPNPYIKKLAEERKKNSKIIRTGSLDSEINYGG